MKRNRPMMAGFKYEPARGLKNRSGRSKTGKVATLVGTGELIKKSARTWEVAVQSRPWCAF